MKPSQLQFTVSFVCLLVQVGNLLGEQRAPDGDPDRLAELGMVVTYRLLPTGWTPGLTTLEQEKESQTRQFASHMTDESGIIRFAKTQRVEISIGDFTHEIADVRWLGMFKPGELYMLSVVPSRLPESAARHIKLLGLHRLELGFRTIQEVRRLKNISSKLEDVYLYEIPNGLFETRRDIPPHHWTAAERVEMISALKDLLAIGSLRSVRLSIAGMMDEVAIIASKREGLEVVDLRGQHSELSDVGLRALSQLPKLREFGVKVGPKITKDGIAAFGACKQLERIEFRNLPDNLHGAVMALKDDFPKLEIVLERSGPLDR